MDPPGSGPPESQVASGTSSEGQAAGNLTDDERTKLGAQQAALIQMQEIQDAELEEKAIRQQALLDDERRQRNLMDAQKEALAIQQQAMLQQEQRHMQEQQQLQILQVQAINENQQMQQIALQQKEEQDQRLQQQRFIQEQSGQPAVVAPGVVPPPPGLRPTSMDPGQQCPPMIQAGPPVVQGGTTGGPPAGPPMMQGGPPMAQAGPPGGPPMVQGGPPGGPPMVQGGPPGGPPIVQGGPPRGPPMVQGGPLMVQGGPPGGPHMVQGGPPGGPPMVQGGPSGGPPMVQGGPPGGPPMVQGGPPGGPPMVQGGPPRGPPMVQGGPPRGPPMVQGGPPGRPPMVQGGPLGGQPMVQGGPPGGPHMVQGGPPMSHAGPPIVQGGPPMSQGGPPMVQGGPPMVQTGPPMSQGGPTMIQGGPPMMQAGPPGGPPMMHGGPPMMHGGPPMMQGGSPLMQRPQPPQMQQMPPQQMPPQQKVGGHPMMSLAPPGLQSLPSQMAPPGEQLNVTDTEGKGDEDDGMKLPMALERVLAFKETRAQQVGVEQEVRIIDSKVDKKKGDHDMEMRRVEEEEEEEGAEEGAVTTKGPEMTAKEKKEAKNKKRKKKKKKRARVRTMQTSVPAEDFQDDEDETEIEIEYVPERLNMSMMDPNYSEFSRIFQTFKLDETSKVKESRFDVPVDISKAVERLKAMRNLSDDDDSDDSDEETKPVEEEKPKLSKKKMKKLSRLSVAELKQLVSRPDVVEMHDITAQDPKLLVHLKATRNTVPVPRHWCFKRKYLQGKRGIEKPPFDLPDYIKATGIMEMREALAEKEDQKNLKAKMRERVRPKMGKIDIDYQKLHDAFFKWQTKPKLSMHGELYYEGKEFETRLREKKPGNLSDDLRTALGMPIGPNSDRYPPPWLIAMQRYGPPPSYPSLKIPGLNSPIPESCSFGYHAGGWGKPPVDEIGKPLYGDVFGTQSSEFETPADNDQVDVQLWGDLESSSESGEESESESDEAEDADTAGLVTPAETGLVTPSGLTSVPIGVETPDMIELRKKRIEDAMDQGGDTPALYQVLPEKKTAVGGAMMGSAHVYDMSGMAAKRSDVVGATEGIEVALNPEELDLDTAAMQAKYDQTVMEQQSHLEKEDLSDMVAEHAAKQKKRKKQLQDTGRGAKKYKDFKF